MHEFDKPTFDAEAFLATAGFGRTIVKMAENQAFFSQGDIADGVFYLQSGSAKLTVVSAIGKEATITLLSAGDFVGQESLASVGAVHRSTAKAVTECTALRIERAEMIRAMHDEPPLSEIFISYLLGRGMQTESDFIDQLFNSTEKRLARLLLLMAEFGEPGESERLIPKITEEGLAQIVGATPARIAFFMRRFRDLGLIGYNDRITVNRSLLNVILHDRFPDDNAVKPAITGFPQA